jgi:hypothetical protein
MAGKIDGSRIGRVYNQLRIGRRQGSFGEEFMMSKLHCEGVFPAVTTQFKRDQSLDLPGR